MYLPFIGNIPGVLKNAHNKHRLTVQAEKCPASVNEWLKANAGN